MEIDRSSALNWAYCSQDKGMEELRYRLLCVSVELENTKVAAQQELRRRDEQLVQLREVLERTVRERDDAQEKYQKALLENLLLQQQMSAAPVAPPMMGVSSVEEEPRRGEKDSCNNTFNNGCGFSSSDCEDSIVSSPIIDFIHPPSSRPRVMKSLDSLLLPEKPLPEKGKLLQAVMQAGPLLQTLLLAGPLPQWQHPPPLLESSDIPPVKIPSLPTPPAPPQMFLQDSLLINNNNTSSNSTLTSCGRVCNKRGYSEGLFDFPTETKYQRVALP